MTSNNPITVSVDGNQLYANSQLLGVVSLTGGDNISLDNSGSVINVVSDPSFTTLNVDGSLNVDGNFINASDTDATATIGRCKIGYNGSDVDRACFAHYDNMTSTNYALMHGSNGFTNVNAAAGRELTFKIGNTAQMRLRPGGMFDIYKLIRFLPDNIGANSKWFIGPWYKVQTVIGTNTTGSDSKDFVFAYGHTTEQRVIGYISHANNVNNIDFTGQHRGFIENIPAINKDMYNGLIVCANKNEYFSISSGRKVERGIESIGISESLPYVSLCSSEQDKSCYGVIAGFEGESRDYANGTFISVLDKTNGDTRAYINSVGEGAIWVSNKNGTLESGDYVTTSSIPGYGQLQNDDILHNYTVAKITMDCDFNPPLEYKKQIKKINIEFTEDTSGNYFDLSGNMLYGHDISGNKVSKNDIYDMSFNDAGSVLHNVTKNILDDNGEIQWEDSEEQLPKYKIRYVDSIGNILTEEQYNDKINANEEAYITAFVGCTYHCG